MAPAGALPYTPDTVNIDPRLLHILTYPDPSLRQKAGPVGAVDDHVRAVAIRMIELMHEAEGIGLAAPQVGLPWRLFVAYVPEGEGRSADSDPAEAMREPVVYINPRITALEGDLEPSEEGCLSLPDITGEVRRPPGATIEALDLDGERFTARAHGLLARCWQHENDHLDGVLIIDRMTQLSRMKNRTAVRALERQPGGIA